MRFVDVQVPGGWSRATDQSAGATISYIAVMATVAVHSILVCMVVALYILSMRHLPGLSNVCLRY